MIPQDFLTAIGREHHLSSAEQEVLCLAMEGQSTAMIAQQLSISGDAVRKRLSEVYQKFQITGRGPVKLTKLQQILVSRYQEQQIEPQAVDDTSVKAISTPQLYWGEAPDISVFYGRTSELEILKTWIVRDRCRAIALLGMAGIGKTALAVKLAQQIQQEFESVIWLSLRQTPPLGELLSELVEIVVGSNRATSVLQQGCETVEQQISMLIAQFRQHRCLLILDGAESILQSGYLAGVYRDGYEAYGDLLKRFGQESHQSCLLVTSQEKPTEIALLEGETSPVRSLKLDGLDESAAQRLLTEKGLTGDPKKWSDLIRGYRGNPFMLKMVATTIKEVFDGNVTPFLKTTLFTHDISDYIEEILDRLSDLEEQILDQIALKQQPMAMEELIETLPNSSPQDLIQALQSLKQRSLVETSEGRFNLPPAVMDVISQNLSDEID